MHRERSHADIVVPLLLAALALSLRIATITSQPLSGDEAMHLQPLGLWDMVRLDLALNPPLFRLLVRLCTLISPTPLAARIVPLVAGVAAVPVLYLVARRHLPMVGATFASLLLALHPWHIRHSQTVRAYALLTLLWLLSAAHTWSSVSAVEEVPQRRAVVRHLAIAAALLFTHYLGFALLAIEVAILVLHRRWRHALLLSGLVVLTAAALAPVLGFGAHEKLSGATAFYTSGLPFLMAVLQAMATPGGLSLLAVWALAVTGAVVPGMRPVTLLTAGALLAIPVLGLVMPIEIRYALPALPFLLVLAGRGASLLLATRRPVRRVGAAAVLLLAVAGTAYLIPTYYRAPIDPRTALERHRDLVHEAAPLPALVQRYRSIGNASSPPLVLMGRGRVAHQVLVALGGGRYPDAAVVSQGPTTKCHTGEDFTLIAHESPGAPGEACPHWPEPPFALLFEAPLFCDLPAVCRPLESAVRFSLHDCPAHPRVRTREVTP